MYKVLIVGQTPPPYGGQGIMIDRLLNGDYKHIELFHLRMDFSDDMDDMGNVSFRKFWRLIKLIVATFIKRFTTGCECLYYPPAGPDLVPALRDIVYLICCRWLFKYTVFHFHAGGLSQLEPALPPLLRPFYRLAYFGPDLAIELSPHNPPDGRALHANHIVHIPYGIPDEIGGPTNGRENPTPRLLFVGVLRESKGITDLIRALNILKRQGYTPQLDVLGKFQTKEFEQELRSLIKTYGLDDQINFHGVRTGQDKYSFYRNADIFCFPTFFESETFGIVLLEAMQSSLPVVATRWRGVQSIVREGKNGFLIEIKQPGALADKIRILIDDPVLRESLGAQGRRIFEQDYELASWHIKIEEAILSAINGGKLS